MPSISSKGRGLSGRAATITLMTPFDDSLTTLHTSTIQNMCAKNLMSNNKQHTVLVQVGIYDVCLLWYGTWYLYYEHGWPTHRGEEDEGMKNWTNSFQSHFVFVRETLLNCLLHFDISTYPVFLVEPYDSKQHYLISKSCPR